MVQQEKRKHGHCTLLTCVRNNRKETKREQQKEDERQKEIKKQKREESKIYNRYKMFYVLYVSD